MSKVGIGLRIDVSKIEKARLFKGKKGTYLDATVFVDLEELDEYGNSGMITQDVTKEERDSEIKGPILGNAKVFWKGGHESAGNAPQANNGAARTSKNTTAPPANFDFDSDVPF